MKYVFLPNNFGWSLLAISFIQPKKMVSLPTSQPVPHDNPFSFKLEFRLSVFPLTRMVLT